MICSCIQWFKDTNLKANHNRIKCLTPWLHAVFNGSKILIWKQITTLKRQHFTRTRCIQWFKDTNLKANHNSFDVLSLRRGAVFNGSKILIWKQITTILRTLFLMLSCIQWFKDTNLKANHNFSHAAWSSRKAVFNGSKILIWKQITTISSQQSAIALLYSMVQRY